MKRHEVLWKKISKIWVENQENNIFSQYNFIVLESTYVVIWVWFDENKIYSNTFEKRTELLWE